MKKTLNLTVAFVLMLATVFVFCAFFAHSALPNATERDGLETIRLTSEEEGKLSLINASGKSDQTFAVRGKEFLVGSRLVIESMELGIGYDLAEIHISGLIGREEDEMIAADMGNGGIVDIF